MLRFDLFSCMEPQNKCYWHAVTGGMHGWERCIPEISGEPRDLARCAGFSIFVWIQTSVSRVGDASHSTTQTVVGLGRNISMIGTKRLRVSCLMGAIALRLQSGSTKMGKI